MKSLLAVILLGILLPGCSLFNKTPCASHDSVAGLVTGYVTALGQCNAAGSALILADVSNVASKLNLCTAAPAKGMAAGLTGAGLFAEALCAPIITGLEAIVGGSLNAKYPGCNFTAALNSPTALLSGICTSLPMGSTAN